MMSKNRFWQSRGHLSRTGALLALAGVLAGCSANQHSIFRVANMEGKGPVVVSVDAKQRAIVGNYRDYRGRGDISGERTRRFCSEPSPDAFSVLAQAFSGGGSFGQTADPAALEIAANFAASTSESGATIARTQTTNTLRELMFRTCERYMNGAIDELEMSSQAARDQRLIVSILAIEQLTGAVTPPTVVINTNGNATAGASGDAIVALDAARKQRDTTAATTAAAQKAYDEVNGTGKLCEANPVADDNKAKCTDASGKLAGAKIASAKAAEDYQLLSSLARSGGVSVTTGSQASDSTAGFTASPQTVEAVAKIVKEIVGYNVNDRSEVLLFCFKSFDPDYRPLADLNDERGDRLRQQCSEYIQAIINADRQRVVDQVLLGRESAALDQLADTNFTRFWDVVASDGRLDLTMLQAWASTTGVRDSQLKRNGRPVFTAGMDRAAAFAAFETLSTEVSNKLGRK